MKFTAQLRPSKRKEEDENIRAKTRTPLYRAYLLSRISGRKISLVIHRARVLSLRFPRCGIVRGEPGRHRTKRGMNYSRYISESIRSCGESRVGMASAWRSHRDSGDNDGVSMYTVSRNCRRYGSDHSARARARDFWDELGERETVAR